MLYQAYVIFSKEFGGYFRSRLAYFLIGAYAFISMFAAFYMGAFFDLNNMELYSFFYFQGDVFALLVPALTMRLWAEERRSGTMELLLTQPVSYTAVVLGKFLSAWVFCLLLLLATVPFLLCPAAIYPLDYLNILSSYLACFFHCRHFLFGWLLCFCFQQESGHCVHSHSDFVLDYQYRKF